VLIQACAWAFIASAGFWPEPGAYGQDRPGAGTWTVLAPAPTKRTEVAAAASGGKIYVLGGFEEPSLGNLTALTISDNVEEYDPVADHWTTKAPLPAGLHHAGAAALDGRLYVVGGYSKSVFSVWHPVASLYIYNPVTDTWIEGAPMPTPRGALAVVESGGKLFAIGGYDGSANSAAVEMYDPVSNRWSRMAPLPTPRDHLAAATAGSRVYAIGGRLNGDYSRNLGVTEVYDPGSDRWTRVADLPTPRSGIAAGVIRGVIYVTGGEAPAETFRTNEAYSPETGHWVTMAPLPTGRHGLGTAVVTDRLYVLGGGPTPGGSYSNVNEAFAPPAERSESRPDSRGGGRASAKQVGTVMALLATFQDAGSLPPESSPEANRLIKALIQFQAAFMKSPNPAVRRFLADALAVKLGDRSPAAVEAFRTDGWTSQSLEAFVDYAENRSVWDRSELEEGLRAYNIGRSDYELLARTYRTARRHLAAQGQDLHQVYAARRREMPGAGL
jgi:N-acetylneuraminic acid mutarotase